MIFVAALSAFAFCPYAALGFPALEELESRAGDGPEVLAAISAMQRDSLGEALELQR